MLNLFCCPQVDKKKIYLKNYILLQVSEGTVAISLSVFSCFQTNILSFKRLNTSKEKGGKQTNKSQPCGTSSSSHADVRGRGEGCSVPTWTQEGCTPLAAPGGVSLSSDACSAAATQYLQMIRMSHKSLWLGSLRLRSIYTGTLWTPPSAIPASICLDFLTSDWYWDSCSTGAGKVSPTALLWCSFSSFWTLPSSFLLLIDLLSGSSTSIRGQHLVRPWRLSGEIMLPGGAMRGV